MSGGGPVTPCHVQSVVDCLCYDHESAAVAPDLLPVSANTSRQPREGITSALSFSFTHVEKVNEKKKKEKRNIIQPCD
ncbi:hypothetical protein E2C01_051271 [Portunus trituberculatus]|uniref:Uncharacterized protein n=1 Tax=Portunus trituberculatus TaxID=210409 RepID=A0A5B7GLB6_PORTR|nr:hypothetical protein [Portunus trituberculatus]